MGFRGLSRAHLCRRVTFGQIVVMGIKTRVHYLRKDERCILAWGGLNRTLKRRLCCFRREVGPSVVQYKRNKAYQEALKMENNQLSNGNNNP